MDRSHKLIVAGLVGSTFGILLGRAIYSSIVHLVPGRFPRVEPDPLQKSAVKPQGHRNGSEHIRQALRKLQLADTLPAIQILGGIAVLESSYGRGCYVNKKTDEKNCNLNNFGAIQGKKVEPSRGMDGGWPASDYNPIKGEWYVEHYQSYQTPSDGARHLIEVVRRFSPNAPWEGDILRTSIQMYTGKGTLLKPIGYYQGHTRPLSNKREDVLGAAWANIETHARKIFREAYWQAIATEQPLKAFLTDPQAFRQSEEGQRLERPTK